MARSISPPIEQETHLAFPCEGAPPPAGQPREGSRSWAGEPVAGCMDLRGGPELTRPHSGTWADASACWRRQSGKGETRTGAHSWLCPLPAGQPETLGSALQPGRSPSPPPLQGLPLSSGTEPALPGAGRAESQPFRAPLNFSDESLSTKESKRHS